MKPADREPFPAAGSVRERLRFLVRYAVQAPSGHNTQPWKFVIGNDRLELRADRSRALPVVDPRDRELTISCGAALEHLVIAARHFGLATDVSALPGSDPDLLAVLRISGAQRARAADASMFDAMSLRHTSRARFADRPVPARLCAAASRYAAQHGIEMLQVVAESEREALAELVAEGDRLQFEDPRFRDELAAWIHSRRAATGDGLSGRGFGVPDRLSVLGALLVRHLDLGAGVAQVDVEKVLHASPVLAALVSRHDEPADWLATGRALSGVLLTLAAAGVSAGFLNQPVEEPELRSQLADVLGTDGWPQLLLRAGFGPRVRASARRPLGEVIVDDS